MRYRIGLKGARKRLDVFVASKLPNLSRAFIQRLIDEGRIKVGRRQEKPGYRLRLGEAVNVSFDDNELEQIPDIDMPVIYEDKDVLVVNKPAGVISHARGRFWNEPSVASFIRQKTDQDGERAGLVHRLDRATSGVMVCAKNQEALSWLQKQFSMRSVKKTYFAVVSGQPDPAAAIIDMPIARNPKKPQTFKVASGGKHARTRYQTVKTGSGYSLLKLMPETGRTHQLRVHLHKIGKPIVGDELYGEPPAERLFLHAESLDITLPDGRRQTFKAPLPKEFKDLLR